MRALVWEAPRTMVMRDQAIPAPGPDEALIKVAFAGICGSELSGYLGHNALRVPPLVMGHEFSGELVAIGAAARAANPALAEGQLITVNPMVTCGQCRFCCGDRSQLCPARQLIGAHRAGGFAEYVAVPASCLHPLPPGMSLHTGALAEPVAVAVRIAALAGPLAAERALIIGAGPIGLLALQTLRLQGAEQLFVSDLEPARLEMAAALGGTPLDARSQDVVQQVAASTGQEGVAVTVDAVGTARTRAQCVGATRSAGKLILSGLHEESSQMPAAAIIRREITVQGCFCYTHADFARAIELLEQGAIRLDPWVVEEPLATGGSWFERLIDAPGAVAKVLLTP
jgi:threonine dehydrogenase-like Zn-dependent dehydrogenase